MMFYNHYDKRSWAEAHTQIVNCRKVYTTYIYICFGEGDSNPLQHSCLEISVDGGVW